MNTKNNAYNYTGDRPITEEKDDKLGFSALADQIALSLTQAKIEDGFVVGIEGEWGSGKSSLINLIKNKIEKEQDIIIVDFKPWLVGNRDILIDALFCEFVTALKEYFPYNEIAKNFKSFIKAAEDGFPKIKLLTVTKYPVNLITFFLKKINAISYSACIDIIIEFLYSITSEKSLSNLKNQLTTIFQDIGRRIIVVIDDLDRLDPSEAIEVLRLVRSVADFPNVTYVLSYDRNILCKAIEEQIKIDSGQSYLEKIIQLTIPLFLPNFSDLLSWFKDELYSLVPRLPSYQKLSIDISLASEGWHRVKTPRVLIKILDSIRFIYLM
ncbi:KAP-like P-loop domain-containing protein [Zymomonas mobilis]|uniref:KAP-like P-loop domain-containing protein n=1 Tax=Zymomonas mobilis TaxID=542 RepID=A0A542VUH5_ZYMMB|nr:P-loop NTPase fold protein [Zymomonas mobilis]TQL14970.1 KAP-like P-loop domain-containing protein [Zymomonas mobilis]